ncbi:MAG TPA: tRNA preQ1(34) S-adenosylmethionine ribosyltransferase-isomerase QueA [Woeseiaceae bacterium]|nr:tRNA preQ1(34) S-adenosylmethionine ribosyltransferase-isomerase QueA [Woeseiaceae bacterium]
MQLADFDFELPGELIAQRPLQERRASRLLLVDPRCSDPPGRFDDRHFAELPHLLAAGDLLVFNDTRVLKARLDGHKASGGRIELLIERVLDDTTALALIRASKAPRIDSRLQLADGCEARVTAREGELYRLAFSRPVLAQLEACGTVPLPPYVQRPATAEDDARYQTVYAREPGAVAAPTAGLHFDAAMLEETRAAGVEHATVTLHVGAGTFQNLRSECVEANRLHSERVLVTEDTCRAVARARARGGRVIAVGTTSVRALEAASRGGILEPFDGDTDLFIVPGYEFRQIDAMLTNFHLPRSSLLILVSAFAGRGCMLDAYRHAVAARYRFFSYGDAMLIRTRAP